MIRIKTLDWTVMDAWPIAEAGLPPRVVHVSEVAGLCQVGDLRRLDTTRRLALPGLGAASAREVERFLTVCEEIHAGRCLFPDFQGLLEAFLRPAQVEVLKHRHGLCLPPTAEPGEPPTLQAVGDRQNVCRERVRQVEQVALDMLHRNLAAVCLEPVVAFFDGALRTHGGFAEPADIDSIPNPGFFGTSRPAAILSLLCNVTNHFANHRGFFLIGTPNEVNRIEKEIEAILKQGGGLMPVSRLIEATGPLPAFDSPDAHGRVMRFLLARMPGITITLDEDCFLEPTGAARILERIMQQRPSPIHFRDLQAEYNRRVRIGRRQGTGYILEVLRSHDLFQCVHSGHYARRSPPPPESNPASMPDNGVAPS